MNIILNLIDLIIGHNVFHNYLMEAKIKATARYIEQTIISAVEIQKLDIRWVSLSAEAKLYTISRETTNAIDAVISDLDLKTIQTLRNISDNLVKVSI